MPIGICPSCFNEQQQYSFPFLVYCPHSETLAVMRATTEHATFRCAPAQLEGVLRQLYGSGDVTQPPAGGAGTPAGGSAARN